MGLLYVFIGVICLTSRVTGQSYNVYNALYHFPSGSGMGLYVAVAWPLTDINIDVFGAVFLEAYYSLPFNDTQLQYPPVVSDRSLGRRSVYESLISKFDAKGYPGKACLLRSICEAASYSMQHFNGVLGDLFHILLTPSTSSDSKEDYFLEYWQAEEAGTNTQNCESYNACRINLLDLMSFIK
ncbi:uncharacterized protein LOC143193758 [Rhynchophorus ferrugineus]|uniref:uncharacterized protein LOC143193758 n=1 Tax=Rhynchophorus ferrugineus TaxID=354439 RepID=UPI003FCC340B